MAEKRENSIEGGQDQPNQPQSLAPDLGAKPVVPEAKQENQETKFTVEQLVEIESKRQILSSLAYFIGKDFKIPVELNQPGAGWHWDFKENVIRTDPKDLLEKPMDYLRFVISHEGGHRRISRTESIPVEEWRQPGFSFMMNAIEDPRDNNFVAESYPKFKEQMQLAYEQDLDFEAKAKEKASQKLGYQPRFMQAGFEYIKQWHREMQGQETELSADLPDDVRAAVQSTIESAKDSWWRYPSRQEADIGGKIGKKKVDGETMIKNYARLSYEINKDEIWPEFKKLVEKDLEDQKTQEFLKDMQQPGQESGEGGQGLPQELKDKLSPEEQKQLQEAIEKAIEDTKKGAEKPEGQGRGKPLDMDSLSEELKQKIKEYVDSLPQEQKEKINEQARSALKDFEGGLNEELQGKLSDDPEKKADRETSKAAEKESGKADQAEGEDWGKQEKADTEDQRGRRKRIEQLFETGEKDSYHESLKEVSELVDVLTADLHDVFVKRKVEKRETGYRSGRRWNIRKRIREKVAGIPLFKTEALEQKESESEEMDYAVTLMVDLSGSMQHDGKIQEAFKSAVVLAETLNNLDINFEIVGFQDDLLEFKSFDDHLDEAMREKLSQMILEVAGQNPGGHNRPIDNDDGACLRQASEHLANQTQKNKFLIVISDGLPETENKSREQLDRELKEAVAQITANTNQKLVGLGLNSKAVARYYENNIAGITTKEMVETLGGLLREIIERY